MNFVFGMQINIEVFYKLILSFWLCITKHVQSTQNKFAYTFNISRLRWCIKLIFFAHKQTQAFYISWKYHLGCLARYAQSIQKKFRISLQYLMDNVKDEVDFLPGKRFL